MQARRRFLFEAQRGACMSFKLAGYKPRQSASAPTGLDYSVYRELAPGAVFLLRISSVGYRRA